MNSILDDLSPFLVFVLFLATLIGVAELGYHLGRWFRREEGLDKYPLESSANGTVFGLLAFVLAFAFGVTASRIGDLRNLARNDTDAIGDLYLMTDFLADEDGQKVRALLREYHTVRVEAIESQDPARWNPAIRRAEEIHGEIWKISVAARSRSDNSILNQYIAAVHAMMDTHNERVSKALVVRLPGVIWWTIFSLLVLSSLMLGFASGLHGRRSRLASTVVIVAFSAVTTMIIDLDRPVRTMFRVPDPTAKALLDQMNAEAGR